jgi:hypothetical protein
MDMELATTSTMTDDYVFRFTAALQIRKVAGDPRQLGRLPSAPLWHQCT